MPSRVSTSRANGRLVYHLHDETGASASILPSYGFNLFDLRLPIGDEIRPIVASAPDFAENPSRPARSGFPILFPFPGRIRNAMYAFNGVVYELVANKPPHAIHGFALDAEWDVIDHSVTPSGEALINGRFQISKNAPDAVGRWPADAILTVQYTLHQGILLLQARVANPSDRPLPWGFGLHAYFHLPFDRRDDLATAKVEVAASEAWVLEDSLPTGRRISVEGTPLDYRQGRPMDGLAADDALTGLSVERKGSVARLIDEQLDAELRIDFLQWIRDVVVFTPPDRRGVVAVEPYTQMADAFALRDRGIDSGMRILAPGENDLIGLAFQTGVLSTIRPIGKERGGWL